MAPTGKTPNVKNLFLAMCALLSVTSSVEAGVNYGTYIPNPPLFEPVFWGDVDASIFTYPAILPPPLLGAV